MEKIQNQKQQEIQNQDKQSFMQKFENWIVFYGDMTVRGLISFFISILLVALLNSKLHFPSWAVLSIAFVCSIGLSPFFIRVKVTQSILHRYTMLLNKTFGVKQ